MKKIGTISILSALSIATVSTTPLYSCAFSAINKTQSLNSTPNGKIKITFCLKDSDKSTGTIVGQTSVSAKSGRKFGSTEKPKATKPNCEFDYWSDTNDNKYSDTTEIGLSDITLYANFKIPTVEQFDVTLFLNGGTVESKQIITISNVAKGTSLKDLIDTETITEPDGYEFDYWADENGTKIEDSSQEFITRNRCYYVNWKFTVVEWKECPWNKLKTWCRNLEEETIDESTFCSHFSSVTVDVWENSAWTTKTYYSNPSSGQEKLESVSQFVGATKSIKLNMVKDAEPVEHTVRVVDVQHDLLKNQPTGKTAQTATLTFEFKTLISDSSGRSIAALWNNIETSLRSKASLNYKQATIISNLDGDNEEQVWLEAQASEASTTYVKSVKNMLPVSPVQVVKKITTTKDTWETTDTTKSLDDESCIYYPYCFLPTMTEVGFGSNSYTNANEGTQYKLWANSMTTTSYAALIHKQIDNSAKYGGKQFTNTSGKIKFQGTVKNFAGYNSVAGETGNGSDSWLASPFISASNPYDAFGFYTSGGIGHRSCVDNVAFPIAPYFCL